MGNVTKRVKNGNYHCHERVKLFDLKILWYNICSSIVRLHLANLTFPQSFVQSLKTKARRATSEAQKESCIVLLLFGFSCFNSFQTSPQCLSRFTSFFYVYCVLFFTRPILPDGPSLQVGDYVITSKMIIICL